MEPKPSARKNGRCEVNKAMKMLVLVAGIFATKSMAETEYFTIYGNSCQSTTEGLMGQVSQHGLGNPSPTTALNVVCPVTLPVRSPNYSEGYISLSGFDRHGSEGVSCTMNFSSITGDVINSVTSTTRGSSISVIKYGNGVRVTPSATSENLWVTCRIPPTYNGGWMSVLTSVYFGLTD
jgi:hypothetical protein